MLKRIWNWLFPYVPSFVCRWCSQEYKMTKAVRIFTSSDERHQVMKDIKEILCVEDA